MKQQKQHKKQSDKNIYDVRGFENYTKHHNDRKDAGIKPIPSFLQKEQPIIINQREGIL
jgi:hypothetical protein